LDGTEGWTGDVQLAGSFLFKKRYLYQAKEFYDKHGALQLLELILPFIEHLPRSLQALVQMDRKSFIFIM
jgi:membrane-associated protein